MPPKYKFTREEIIRSALDIVRGGGMSALTARSLASSLGSSAKPIFGLFENMKEVEREVLASANAIYNSYIEEGMSSGKYPPYKASGIAYIEFAKNEAELFKLLFMRDRRGEELNEGREALKPIIEIISENLGLSEEEAFLFHMKQWIYVHGIATMLATSYLDWDTEFISKSVSDVYFGLKERLKNKK